MQFMLDKQKLIYNELKKKKQLRLYSGYFIFLSLMVTNYAVSEM